MNTDYNSPQSDRDNAQWKKEQEVGKTTGANNAADHKSLETEGPNKTKPFNVLNQDGSLADDLPNGTADGSGALDGTVGLGT